MQLSYRRLEPDEKEQVFPPKSANVSQDRAEFEAMLRGLSVGDAVTVSLDGLTERAMKRRIGQAAKSVLGLPLRYKLSADGGELSFVVREAATPRNATGDAPTPLPDAGRRRAVAAS